jgi:hypothetical protein
MEVQAQYLQPGDYLRVTDATVTYVSASGLGIPSGKVRIDLVYANGNQRTTYWGKYTEISVERECRTCQMPEQIKPSHDGSPRCESGSIASGGKNAHCTCDVCF